MQRKFTISACGPLDNLKKVELVVPDNKNIAVMLSSGADSAILLYMLCLAFLQNKQRPESEIKAIMTIPKVDGAEDHASKIVSWINQKLDIKLPMPTCDGPEKLNEIWHGDILLKSMYFLAAKYDFNFAFLGDQQAVPEPYKIPGTYPLRLSENLYPNYVGMPFIHVDKSHTIDLHYILDTVPLLELSHSCTEQRAGRCLQCYHCHERSWAFERLGKTDPGSN